MVAVHDQMISDVAKEIAARKGITVSHAYKEARKQQLQEGIAVPQGWSKKDYVLEALYRLNSNSGVKPETIVAALKAMDIQTNLAEVTKLCWDLQKQQYLLFKEAHGGHGSYLTRIRLTPAGREFIAKRRGSQKQPTAKASELEDLGVLPMIKGKVHAVGVDKTDARNHGPVAEGGPIEVVTPKPPEPEVVPAPIYTAPIYTEPVVVIPYVDPNPLNQNMKAPITAAGYDLTDYPNIRELMKWSETKKALREKAARFVEAASMIADIDVDEADRLMTKAGELEGAPLTRLEMEVVRLVEALSRRDNGTSSN